MSGVGGEAEVADARADFRLLTLSGDGAHSMQLRFEAVTQPYPIVGRAVIMSAPGESADLLKRRLLKEHGHGRHEGTYPQE